MTHAVMLHGSLASHRRGGVLRETLSATVADSLPDGRAAVLVFAEEYQSGTLDQQRRLVDWTRRAGHLLILLPPMTVGSCEWPVPWGVERLASPPRDGVGIARHLAGEVSCRLTGRLQTPPLPGATWTDLSVCTGTYRPHPAAGLFVVTCLPLWSLATLDAPHEVTGWVGALVALAGEEASPKAGEPVTLQPDHYGLLVFLLSGPFRDEEDALARLDTSPVFRFSPERARSLLEDLQERRLVVGAEPSVEAHDLVMQSPYAPYVSAVREVSR